MLDAYYDAEFSGVSFWEQGQHYPDRHRTTEGGVLGDTFVQLGAGAEPFEVAAAVDEAEYLALMGARGEVGSLVFSGGTLTCKLLSILDRPGKAGIGAYYTVQLRFQP